MGVCQMPEMRKYWKLNVSYNFCEIQFPDILPKFTQTVIVGAEKLIPHKEYC